MRASGRRSGCISRMVMRFGRRVSAGEWRVSVCEEIRSLARKVELLAPAGRWDALAAVLDAGADAVYLGAKQFNMRRHRRDFNFGDSQLADAVALAHERGARAYVVVNAMLGETELPPVRGLLRRLAEIEADAVIVQDLAVLRLARELSPGLSLHASTMMNVHHPEHALALKSLGISRIIASRDIDIRTIGEIGRLADIEVECFIHGDMCAVQSGQCGMSGLLFGKSANRGECMKPCRWAYELVRLHDARAGEVIRKGHLLAIKDLCLIHRIPQLVQAGICSLKIEGRMRDAAYLGGLVGAYRRVIDAFYERPHAFQPETDAIEDVFRMQVRRLSTLALGGGVSHRDHFDITGDREPLFLSDGCAEPGMDRQALPPAEDAAPAVRCGGKAELAVAVADAASAVAAIDAGADRVYFATEIPQYECAGWTVEEFAATLREARARGVKVGIQTPRITTDREWAETCRLLERVASLGPDHVLVHHPGTLRLAREVCPEAMLIADFGMNVLNSAAAGLLAELGAGQVTVSNEAGFADLCALASATTVPLEILAHGPLTGMLTEHCLIALYLSPEGRKDVCRGPCRRAAFGLRDARGQLRPIIADRHCRNHVLTGHDLAILPAMERFLLPTVRSMRIEGRFYRAAHVRAVTRAYRLRLDHLSGHTGEDRGNGRAGAALPGIHGQDARATAWLSAWAEACRSSPRPLNFGPYVRSLIQSRSTATVMRELLTS